MAWTVESSGYGTQLHHYYGGMPLQHFSSVHTPLCIYNYSALNIKYELRNTKFVLSPVQHPCRHIQSNDSVCHALGMKYTPQSSIYLFAL